VIGSRNTLIGTRAGYTAAVDFEWDAELGDDNIALGYGAGSDWRKYYTDKVRPSNNIAIGHKGTANESKTIRIGTPGAQTKTFIAGIRGVSVTSGHPVVIDENGQLGVVTGSLSGFVDASNSIVIGNTSSGSEANAIRIGTQGSQTRTFMAGIRGVSVMGGRTVVIDANGQLGTAPVIPGENNTGIGDGALASNGSAAFNNMASGFNALNRNTTGNNNTASGPYALSLNTTGSNNVALGFRAGENLTTGNNNIVIAAPGRFGESNTIRIGVQGVQTSTLIAGIAGNTIFGGQVVMISSDGRLGVGVVPGTLPVIPGTNNTGVGSGALSNNQIFGAGNTAIGVDALNLNTTGTDNTASGMRALASNTFGNFNTASGSDALKANTNGYSNTASGARALTSNTTGGFNTANGNAALFANTKGYYNTAQGDRSLSSNTEGSYNVALGGSALESNTTGRNNIAVGYKAGSQWNSGSNNIAIGNAGVAGESDTIRIGTQGTQTAAFMAGILGSNIAGGQTVVIDGNGRLGVGPAPSGTLLPVIPGANNAGMGSGALANNQADGENNMASGVNALQMNTSGDNNTASGVNSLNKNSSGGSNTASGVSALQENTTGNNNTANGVSALFRNIDGGNNTAVGHSAMFNNTSGSGNTALGFGAGSAWTTGSNKASRTPSASAAARTGLSLPVCATSG
jgi:hypothetical protein